MPSLPRSTTRRLLGLVAGSALVLSGVDHHDRPGLHWRVPGTGIHVGACRNDADTPLLFAHGRPGTAMYQAGAWRDGKSDRVVAGVAWQDGRALVRAGAGCWIW